MVRGVQQRPTKESFPLPKAACAIACSCSCLCQQGKSQQRTLGELQAAGARILKEEGMQSLEQMGLQGERAGKARMLRGIQEPREVLRQHSSEEEEGESKERQ